MYRLTTTLSPLPAWALIGLFAGSLLLSPRLAHAQEQEPEPSTETETPALPDIAPREIEIRGQLEISLPSLQRQPLSGFNPPPRIPTLSSTRVPYVGTYEQPPIEGPGEMADPPALQAQLEQPAPPLNGELAAGGGRYFTRFATTRLQAPLSANETVFLSGRYRGSSGFEPFAAQPNVETPYDTFLGEVGFRSRRDGFSLDAGVDGFYDLYTLYGARLDVGASPSGTFLAQPERTGRHLEARTELHTHGRIPIGVRARYGGTTYETTLQAESSGADRTTTERRLHLGGDVTVPAGNYAFHLDAAFETAGLGSSGGLDGDIVTFEGGLRADLITRPTLRLTAGGRFLSATVNANPLSAAERSDRYFLPTAQLHWTISDDATVSLQSQPGIQPQPLAQLYRENPYLLGTFAVQPSVKTTDLEAGIRAFAGPLQLAVQGGYQYYTNFQYFTATSSTPYAAGVFVPQYGSARIIHAGLDVSLLQLRNVEVSLGATYRNGQLVGPDTDIPFFAPITGRSVLSYTFAQQRGTVQLVGSFASARYVDRAETAQVDAFFDLDLEAAYNLTSSLGLTVGLHNMTQGTLTRWPRYPQPPLVFTTGLRVLW